MWDWKHLRGEGWFAHSARSLKLGALLLSSGAAMLLHLIVPFWQQPKLLQACSVADIICQELAKRE
jgi:hypothetical protein